jgi:hypothetical protein
MNLDKFSPYLRPLVDHGHHEHEFEAAIVDMGYRLSATREQSTTGIGESEVKTRDGLRRGAKEQYTATMAFHSTEEDKRIAQDRPGASTQLNLNAKTLGEEAYTRLNRLAREALYPAGLSGNTWITKISENNLSVHVDDIRGFQYVMIDEKECLINLMNPLAVTIGYHANLVVNVLPDETNLSLAPEGISGTLLMLSELHEKTRVVGSPVIASTRSSIVRPDHRKSYYELSQIDYLDVKCLSEAVKILVDNDAPGTDGLYNCYLDMMSIRQLSLDPEFTDLFRVPHRKFVFRQGMISDTLGLRFIACNDYYVQQHPKLPTCTIRRPIICAAGALVESDFYNLSAYGEAPKNSLVNVIDNVAMVTQDVSTDDVKILSQSWYWIGNFCPPRDLSADNLMIPNDANASYKRVVMIEHVA